MSKLYHWVLRLLRIEPTFTRYKFTRRLEFNFLNVVLVYRDGKLFKEFNTADRMKLEYIRGLLTKVVGKNDAENVLAGRCDVHLYTDKKIF